MERNVKFSYAGIEKNKILKSVNSCLPKNKTVADYGLVFVSKKKMAELNKKYRGKNKPTNVLSFETGDVVICPAVVSEEAKRYGFTQKKWMTRLIVHGILHLAGYNHEARKDELEMEELEKAVLKKLGVKLI
ncbi:MAG: rRNA maturation RNase YbeY [bacterium]|nr:rRNA maturation RNase YbeY [bacterium]